MTRAKKACNSSAMFSGVPGPYPTHHHLIQLTNTCQPALHSFFAQAKLVFRINTLLPTCWPGWQMWTACGQWWSGCWAGFPASNCSASALTPGCQNQIGKSCGSSWQRLLYLLAVRPSCAWTTQRFKGHIGTVTPNMWNAALPLAISRRTPDATGPQWQASRFEPNIQVILPLWLESRRGISAGPWL